MHDHCVDCGAQFQGFVRMLLYEIVHSEYVNLVYQL